VWRGSGSQWRVLGATSSCSATRRWTSLRIWGAIKAFHGIGPKVSDVLLGFVLKFIVVLFVHVIIVVIVIVCVAANPIQRSAEVIVIFPG
jgi:hypothetical protein